MTGSSEPRPTGRTTERPDAFAGLSVVLSVETDAWTEKGLGDLETLCLAALSATARHAGLPAGLVTEASLTFTGDAEVRAINAEWRGKDAATNVLSFPMAELEPGDAPGPLLGDLVFALETLEREAAGEGKPLPDHLRHLIVHGMLHCLGFDHVEPEDAEAMEGLEIAILADLGTPDPYAQTEPADHAAGLRLASND